MVQEYESWVQLRTWQGWSPWLHMRQTPALRLSAWADIRLLFVYSTSGRSPSLLVKDEYMVLPHSAIISSRSVKKFREQGCPPYKVERQSNPWQLPPSRRRPF